MNQRRRPSPAVYRRRRLAAALLAVFLLALAIWGVRAVYENFANGDDETESSAQIENEDPNDDAPTTSDDDPTDGPPASDEDDEDSDDGDAEPPEDAVEEGHCAPADIEVRARTSHEAYDATTAPLLIMEIENIGGQDCTLNVGTTEQEFRVATGGREVFTTAQCELEGESLEVEFEPGQIERANMLWPRSDSAVDCSEPADLATGEYELTVAVSGITSQPYTFEMTGRSE
ncbi:hypothetical protein [Nesterenkonia haasae]|uniref:hypothetical protein n=1 Tax=Nesterenkonia haasae TaxID=2587813 RepID=UPI001390F4C2|nr:hypothetical protein [Nesterenkonia haasae]NDK31597.1 hypothetical protein [Nesterenkonia haasae]